MLPFLYKTYFGIFNYMKTLENNHNKNAINPLHLLSSVQSNISSTSYKESWRRSTGSSVFLLLVKWDRVGGQLGETGHLCDRRTEGSWKSRDGRCDSGSKPEVRFVFYHVSDKERQTRSEMLLCAIETSQQHTSQRIVQETNNTNT